MARLLKKIFDEEYENYFAKLIEGDQDYCEETVKLLLEKGIEVKTIYSELFHRSMYQVGDMWESGVLSVATEHLATSVTGSLFPLVYDKIFGTPKVNSTVLVSCIVNEYHQLGGSMVADIFELKGWDSRFVGANTSMDKLKQEIEECRPNVLALSVGIFFNMPRLFRTLEIIKKFYPNLKVIAGGQAFRWGGSELEHNFPGVINISSLDELENFIAQF